MFLVIGVVRSDVKARIPAVAGAWGLAALLSACHAFSAPLTLQTNVLGATPSILAFNSGHFYPGSNTREWWRYSGVNGARIFVSPSNIEPSDDLAPVGDGVTSASGFLARRAAIRTNQFNPAYINWTVFTNNYQSNDLAGNNHILVNFSFSELRALGIQICPQITASQSRLPIASNTDWPNMWELWQHYYAQAFHLGRQFDVERYQMYNEPNHPNAGGLTLTNFLLRLQLVSDAVQCALEDVNRLYAKALKPKILAPVTAGSAQSSFDWGQTVVDNRHTNFLDQFDADFALIHVYDYHQYNSTPASFGSSLASLHSLLTSAMAPEARYPTAISEFNTHTGGTFDTMTETLDSPTEYPRFGAICVNLMANGCDELYCFKFSQTASSNPNYPVQKNAMHYVENSLAPYNVGGITKAGEVWRLFAKAFAAGRQRLGVVRDATSAGLDLHASYDPQTHRCFLFSANNTASTIDVLLDLAAWATPAGNRLLVEEVSETTYGAGRFWTTLSASRTLSLNQAPRSVLLFTIPTQPQQQNILAASDDAEVRDGANRHLHFGSGPDVVVRNDPLDAANRSVGLIKFQLPTNDLSKLQFAILSLDAASATVNATAQAHIYGVSGDWSQNSICWTNAPNLKQSMPAGATLSQSVISGLGDTATILGQLVTSSTNTSQKLLDVSGFVRAQTNGTASFLLSQDPRWNLALPSLDPGDVQPDGIRFMATEAGKGPRLILVFPQNATNSPPAARDDFATTTQGVPVTLDVLANDTDPEGTALTVQSFTAPLHGSVSNNNSLLRYYPNPAFYGIDGFSYTVADEESDSSTAFVQVKVTPASDSSAWFWTNVSGEAEACIRGGASATIDQNEAAIGYLMVKYNPAPFDFARKVYFQFNLSGLLLDVQAAATFTVTTHTTNNFSQRVQLWGLNQPYPAFHSTITWHTAQANDIVSNDLLTSGSFSATPIGLPVLIPGATAVPRDFTLPAPGEFLEGDRITLALSGVDDAANNAGGLRLEPGTASLAVRAALPPPVITGISVTEGGALSLSFQGLPGRSYKLLVATNLTNPIWLPASTNTTDSAGAWTWTGPGDPFVPARFYRAALDP